MSALKMTKQERQAVFSLSTILGLRMLGLFMVLPVFSLYAHQLHGATPALIGIAMGIYGLSQAFFQIPLGALSDRIGRKGAYALIFMLQAAVFFVLGGLHSLVHAAIAYAVILFCYGGGFGIMPSFSADYFGTRHMGANYGALLTAWGVAGLAGPLLAAYVNDVTGSFSGALPVVACMLLIATVLPLTSRKPARSTILVSERLEHISHVERSLQAAK